MTAKRDLTPAEQESLLDFIASGKPLRQWLRENPSAPDRKTVDNFRHRTPEFDKAYQAARLIGADEIAQDAVDIIDEEPERVASGGFDPAAVARAKNRAYFRMEALKKWFPQRYGDKVTQELTGPGGGPVQVTKIELVDLK